MFTLQPSPPITLSVSIEPAFASHEYNALAISIPVPYLGVTLPRYNDLGSSTTE